jgi:uncharacterized membrane protein
MKERTSCITISYVAILALSILCIILSIVILYEKQGFETGNPNAVSNFCSALAPRNQCQTVQTSQYSKTLGISNPYYGMIGFGVLAILAVLLIIRENEYVKNVAIAGTMVAGIAALRFLYLQAFVLSAYCVFCMVVDIASLVLMGIGIQLIARRGIFNKKSIKKH